MWVRITRRATAMYIIGIGLRVYAGIQETDTLFHTHLNAIAHRQSIWDLHLAWNDYTQSWTHGIHLLRAKIRRKLLIVLKSIHYLFITAGGDIKSVANGFSVSKSNCVQYWCGKVCVCLPLCRPIGARQIQCGMCWTFWLVESREREREREMWSKWKQHSWQYIRINEHKPSV